MASSLNDSCPSDTDLPTGLPSPNASDDENITQIPEFGIAVPNFCNKLRAMTQHLFSKPEVVVLSDLCSQRIIPVKNEPKKKAPLKDESNIARKPFTSHAGYHSSPRWDSKSPSMRSYDPCDITGGDELEVAGVLFRSWTPGKDRHHLSKTDSDFPSLSESSLSERSGIGKSNDVSLLGLANLSSGSHGNKVQSPSVMKVGKSPVTSTPRNKSRNSSIQESPLPHNPESPLCGDQSFNKSDSKSQSKSGSKSRRRSKKLQVHRGDAESESALNSSPKLDINANNSKGTDGQECQAQQGFDFDGNLRNPVLSSLKPKPQQSGITIPHETSVENRPASPSWNNIVKASSPRLSPIMRIGSPRSHLNQGYPALTSEEPKPVEILKKTESSRGHPNSSRSNQRGDPVNDKKKNVGKVQRVQLMSVDSSCVTPKKRNDSETWSSNSNTAFENRFVEKIAVSGTSPPKKVNPSPIKKLDFSQNNKHSTSSGVKEAKAPVKGGSLFKRQISLISDFDWKKSSTNDHSIKDDKRNMKGNRNGGAKMGNGRGKRAVFSLEDFVQSPTVSKSKDEIGDLELSEEKQTESDEAKRKIGESGRSEELPVDGSGIKIEVSNDEQKKMPAAAKLPSKSPSPTSMTVVADVRQVTRKTLLRAYARTYSYYLEGHHVTSVSKELLFILQLLTCTQEDCCSLTNLGTSIFESIHNCIYFAVLVMKRLKRLFSCLPKPTVCLLAMNQRVKNFSPKLHQFFKACAMPSDNAQGNKDKIVENLSDFNVMTSFQNWSNSISDDKTIHTFKCQRDNFFALYQRYQEVDKDRHFSMDEQVHYVYNPKIAEHKSMVNLMHLAQLFVDLLLKTSIHHSNSRVNYLEMVLNINSDTDGFEKQYEKWREYNSALKLGSPPRWNRNELFFIDFLKAIRCPSFTEILKNVVSSKILELNNSDFENLKDLHSSICIPDDQTPKRCERFTTTVYRLCILAKFLGYLVFDPYTGAEDLSPEESHYIITVREMTPLPLPLHMLLKTAFEKGHLCLTVPWIIQYLSLMDAGASKVTVYSQIMDQLCLIHRHAWMNLFCKGYNNVGLLITSCISWLFENPNLPTGLIYTQSHEPQNISLSSHPVTKTLDTQRLVTSNLLYWCCPFLNAGHIPLVLFALNQNQPPSVRSIVPLTPSSSKPMPASTLIPHQERDKEIDELCQWLRLSLCNQISTDDKSQSIETVKVGDESAQSNDGEPPSKPNKMCLDELTANFQQCHPYLSNCIYQSVDLMCGKVQDYTVNTLLKLAVFEARAKVRKKFMNMDAGEDIHSIKCHILANSVVMASKLSHALKQAFYQTGAIVFQKELPSLIHFLASHMEESIRNTAVDIAQKAAMTRILEWAKVQLGTDVFRRVLINEAEKIAITSNFKSCNLYPSDYLRKPDYSLNPVVELSSSGFDHLQQLSKVLDSALACGSWYMNGQTRGPRPDDVFFQGLMDDFMTCIKNHNVCMDFSFSIMMNFLMHLIIQYIVDAPQNWTDSCLETYVNLCLLFESKRSEDDRISFQPMETSHKAKSMRMKVTNLMSVYSMEWLSKSQVMDHSLTVYCHTLVKLISAGLISVDRTIEKLTRARVNQHLQSATRLMIDRIMVKVLEFLYTGKYGPSGYSVDQVVSTINKTLENLRLWVSEKALTELQGLLKNDIDTC